MIYHSSKYWLCHLVLCLFLFSCNSTPKEKENTIPVRDSNTLINYETDRFVFSYNAEQVIKAKQADKPNEIWFDIIDPKFDATLYCSYLPIDTISLYQVLEDSYHLAYSHVSVSDGINQSYVANDSLKIYATIYGIEGQVATPIQFFVTDSVSHFLRGSLYYNKAVRTDSVSAVTNLLREDVMTLIRTLHWKN